MDLLTHAMLFVHAGATVFMTGLIWFVQIVHYPLFRRIGSDAFAAYEREHVKRTGRVVGPVMVVEALSAAGLALLSPEGVSPTLLIVGAGLLVVIWLSTAFVQVPLHRRLERGWSDEVALRLASTNWVRTIAWSARGVIALAMLIEVGQA